MKTYQQYNKNPKSDNEILNYIKPYLNSSGRYFKNLIMVEQKIGHMVIRVDTKGAFHDRNTSNRIKKFLKRNGFIYNFDTDFCFIRGLNNLPTNRDYYNIQNAMVYAGLITLETANKTAQHYHE